MLVRINPDEIEDTNRILCCYGKPLLRPTDDGHAAELDMEVLVNMVQVFFDDYTSRLGRGLLSVAVHTPKTALEELDDLIAEVEQFHTPRIAILERLATIRDKARKEG